MGWIVVTLLFLSFLLAFAALGAAFAFGLLDERGTSAGPRPASVPAGYDRFQENADTPIDADYRHLPL